MRITGRIEDILSNKTQIDIEDIFSDIEQDAFKFVLVEGPPGSGKSTLVLYLCKAWAKQVIFQQFVAVILIKLNDPKLLLAKTLADLLPCNSRKLAAKVEDAIKGILGRGVLFILDGWDELPPSLPQDHIIYQLTEPDIIQDILPEVAVIVTSRPASSSQLHPLVSARLGILGFTSSEHRNYFRECLNGDLKATDSLMERINRNPVVEGSCSNTFIASIIAHVYIAGDGKLPESNTGIFLYVVLLSLSHCLQNRFGLAKDKAVIETLEDLPAQIYSAFTELCYLAYYGIVNSKVTFDDDDLKAAGVSADICNLGLLQIVPSILVIREKYFYNFLHLSIQELLAAVHVSHMSKDGQILFFKELFGDSRFSAVFRFYAGITKLKICHPIISHIVTEYSELQAKILTQRSKVLMISLLHCVSETEDKSLCELIACLLEKTTLDLGYTRLNMLDCLTIGYFLSVACTTSRRVTGYLPLCSIGSEGCKFLCQGLLKGLSSQQSLITEQLCLDIRLNSILRDGVGYVADIIKKMKLLHSLNLYSNPIGNEGFKVLCDALCVNSTLKELNLGNCSVTLSEVTGPALKKMLNVNKSIVSLRFSENCFTDCSHLGAGLVKNQSVKTLKLIDSNLTDASLQDLCQGLCYIQTLDISDNELITLSGLRTLARHIGCSELEQLQIPERFKSSIPLIFSGNSELRSQKNLNALRVNSVLVRSE